MKQGYMQLELNPKSRYITTFYTHRGLRHFKRLNFGTNSAAELFHEEISQLIVDIHNADNLYDDIIVYGKTQQEHDIALAKFSAKGVSPTDDRVKALTEAPPPATVGEVRSFLGMANYNGSFIRRYSEITAPLRGLTKKNAQFMGTGKCHKAFDTLKREMTSPQVMSCYDPT